MYNYFEKDYDIIKLARNEKSQTTLLSPVSVKTNALHCPLYSDMRGFCFVCGNHKGRMDITYRKRKYKERE